MFNVNQWSQRRRVGESERHPLNSFGRQVHFCSNFSDLSGGHNFLQIEFNSSEIGHLSRERVLLRIELSWAELIWLKKNSINTQRWSLVLRKLQWITVSTVNASSKTLGETIFFLYRCFSFIIFREKFFFLRQKVSSFSLFIDHRRRGRIWQITTTEEGKTHQQIPMKRWCRISWLIDSSFFFFSFFFCSFSRCKEPAVIFTSSWLIV